VREIAQNVIEPYQESTERELKSIKSTIKKAKKDRIEQHQQNVKSLVWQRGLLITILLAILGYFGSQVFNSLMVAHPQGQAAQGMQNGTPNKKH